MRTQIALVAGLLAILITPRAYAAKMLVNMTPELLGGEFSLETTALDGGQTRFTITRDPAHARPPGNSDLQLERGAILKVFSADGPVMRCPIASHETSDGRLVYRFELDDELARRSRFTLSEIEDYRHTGGLGRYIGGGSIYQFELIRFIDPDYEQREQQRVLDSALEASQLDLEALIEQARQSYGRE